MASRVDNNDKLAKQLAESIKALRTRQGWSQEKLANEAFVSESHIAQIERGERNASLEVLYRIAEALDVTVPALFATDKALRTTKADRELLEWMQEHNVSSASVRRFMEAFSKEVLST